MKRKKEPIEVLLKPIMPEQVEEEILGVLKFVAEVMAIFGFDYEVELSTRPEKSIGTDAEWELADKALVGALKTWGLPYDICAGEGVMGRKSTSSSKTP